MNGAPPPPPPWKSIATLASEFAAELLAARAARLREGDEPIAPAAWRARQTVLGQREAKRAQRTWHERLRMGNHEAKQRLLNAAEAVARKCTGRRYPSTFVWEGKRFGLLTTNAGRLIVICRKTGAQLLGSDYGALPD